MPSRIFAFCRGIDLLLLFAVIILSCFGLAALYSIGLGKDPQNFSLFYRQLTVCGVLFILLLPLAFSNYRIYRNISIVLYIGTIVLLCAVLFFGRTVNGTRGWFLVGTFGFQPAELAKIALVLMLARYFSNHTRQIAQLRPVIMSGCIAALPTILVFLQPDFGSAAVLFLIWFGMIIVSGIPKKYILTLLIGLICIGGILWLFLFKEYQRARILTVFAPHADVQGHGYNVHQALIAIGSGQVFGRGFGYGSQSHLKFVPENQTDFIFSVIAEEMGLVGVFIVLLFWVLFFHRLLAIMRSVRDDFALFTILGICFLFIVQVTLNIGGNLGIVPLTGLVLPFISYGGSAQAVALISIGIAQSIKTHAIS